MGNEEIRIKILGSDKIISLEEEIKNKIKEVKIIMEQLSKVKIDLDIHKNVSNVEKVLFPKDFIKASEV